MNIVLRNKDRTLASLTREELEILTSALRHACEPSDRSKPEFSRNFGVDPTSAALLLDALRNAPLEQVHQLDTAEVWAEPGCAVMLRAISVHGDPIELTSSEAREFAERLRLAIEASR